MNFPLLSFVFTIASGVVIGILMTIALVTGYNEIPHIIGACVAGFFLAMPISYIVERKLEHIGITKPKNGV